MSLWIDFLGAEIAYIDTPTFGRTRIAHAGKTNNQAGKGNKDALFLMHGIGGHLEAYSKNILALSKEYHVIAFDYVGHGLSEKKMDIEYTPDTYARHLYELMDAMGYEAAHISGESLGGWVCGRFAVDYPERVKKVILNTAGGIPIVSEKGKQDVINLIELSKKSAGSLPNMASVEARMKWLLHPKNWTMLTEELIATRLDFYSRPEALKCTPLVQALFSRDASDFYIKLEELKHETLFLWTRDNPIHDVAAAEAALKRTPNAKLYIMKADSAHWPQYEDAVEFNDVVLKFLKSGEI